MNGHGVLTLNFKSYSDSLVCGYHSGVFNKTSVHKSRKDVIRQNFEEWSNQERGGPRLKLLKTNTFIFEILWQGKSRILL